MKIFTTVAATPTIIIFFTYLFLSSGAYAFKPKSEQGHAGATNTSLSEITYEQSDGKTIKFTEKAIKEVIDANAGVDAGGGFLASVPHCDDEELIACTGRLRTLRKQAVDAVSDPDNRDGTSARKFLGQALHTLQDFYSHSNWVNNPGLNNSGSNSSLGESTLPQLATDQQTCVNDLTNDNVLTEFGITRITTGYFGSTPSGKCAHGVILGAGIHKDKPGRPFYTQAFAAALASTTEFVNLVKSDLASDDGAIRALFGLGPSIGFVIDDTGSMGPEIQGVKTAVASIINSAAASESPPSSYVLVTFGDPNVSPAKVTSSASTLLSSVNAISIGGGGDCPELSQSGLLAGVSASQEKGKLYLVTDASAKDSKLAANVSEAASKKNITINYAITGSCSPIDPAYYRVAQDTGGQVFVIAPSEIGNLFGLIEPTLNGNIEPLLIISGSLTTPTKSYSIPIDSDITQLTYSMVGTSAVIVRPDGTAIDESDSDVTVTTLSTGDIINIDSPSVGLWELVLQNQNSEYSVSVLGNTDLSFGQLNFVEEQGREEHTGLFPIQGQPLVGSTVQTVADIFGGYASAGFELRTLSGDLIKTVPLLQGVEEDLLDKEFLGEFSLPSEPFRVYATGVDVAGNDFTRAFPKAIEGRTVRISVTSLEAAEIIIGETQDFLFEVTNFGSEASFDLTVADELGFPILIDKTTITLGNEEKETITVSLSAPTSATEGFNNLTFAATNAASPDSNNTASILVRIIDEIDTDGDGFLDDVDACPNSDLSSTVIINSCDSGAENLLVESGCTISDLITEAKFSSENHGSFVSTVTKITKDAKHMKLITGRDYGKINSCAARSKTNEKKPKK